MSRKNYSREMNQSVRECLALLGHESVAELQVAPVGGGCISEAMHVRWRGDDGRQRSLFVKRNLASMKDNFECELAGLKALAESGTMRVPEPVAVVCSGESVWVATQWIESGKRPANFFERFGRELAQLHRATLGDRMGWDRDNYLGSAKQPNQPCNDWNEFVALRRLGFQLRWAVDQGLAQSRLRGDVERVIDRLPEVLDGRECRTSLLHGDLWSGNYLCDGNGRAVIIDPAVYYGCREAEWGMIRLFGGCPSEFADGYEREYPLADGWQRRASVYVLYHLLNHLNLFGHSYSSQCESACAEILSG